MRSGSCQPQPSATPSATSSATCSSAASTGSRPHGPSRSGRRSGGGAAVASRSTRREERPPVAAAAVRRQRREAPARRGGEQRDLEGPADRHLGRAQRVGQRQRLGVRCAHHQRRLRRRDASAAQPGGDRAAGVRGVAVAVAAGRRRLDAVPLRERSGEQRARARRVRRARVHAAEPLFLRPRQRGAQARRGTGLGAQAQVVDRRDHQRAAFAERAQQRQLARREGLEVVDVDRGHRRRPAARGERAQPRARQQLRAAREQAVDVGARRRDVLAERGQPRLARRHRAQRAGQLRRADVVVVEAAAQLGQLAPGRAEPRERGPRPAQPPPRPPAQDVRQQPIGSRARQFARARGAALDQLRQRPHRRDESRPGPRVHLAHQLRRQPRHRPHQHRRARRLRAQALPQAARLAALVGTGDEGDGQPPLTRA